MFIERDLVRLIIRLNPYAIPQNPPEDHDFCCPAHSRC